MQPTRKERGEKKETAQGDGIRSKSQRSEKHTRTRETQREPLMGEEVRPKIEIDEREGRN